MTCAAAITARCARPLFLLGDVFFRVSVGGDNTVGIATTCRCHDLAEFRYFSLGGNKEAPLPNSSTGETKNAMFAFVRRDTFGNIFLWAKFLGIKGYLRIFRCTRLLYALVSSLHAICIYSYIRVGHRKVLVWCRVAACSFW